MKFLATLSILGLLFLVACSGGEESSSQQAAESQTESASHDEVAVDAAETAGVDQDGSEVTLAGKLGCGHCTYHVGTSCSAAIQTAEGTVYILDVDEESETFQDRYSGRDLEVTGILSNKGDTHHVKVDNIKAL